jgi:hypothetical protein
MGGMYITTFMPCQFMQILEIVYRSRGENLYEYQVSERRDLMRKLQVRHIYEYSSWQEVWL